MTAKKSTGKKKASSLNFKKKINDLKKDLKEKDEKLLRSYADIQNLQKRMEKEIRLAEEKTKEKYISELLDLEEILQKAILDDSPKEALEIVIKNIKNLFEREKIDYIKCVGEKFNHNIHHAVMAVEKAECEDNTIIEEVKKGFTIDGKVVKPSQVIVVKNNENKN
ncbi:MAG: nucleotide exchange factor GrpE [Candidatus Thermoplasmatota archaeon]|nr:nucleotide exchange factor GrpE [Candidatus Thermoplasmatota archaeon]